jgi:hypothetical protein
LSDLVAQCFAQSRHDLHIVPGHFLHVPSAHYLPAVRKYIFIQAN